MQSLGNLPDSGKGLWRPSIPTELSIAVKCVCVATHFAEKPKAHTPAVLGKCWEKRKDMDSEEVKIRGAKISHTAPGKSNVLLVNPWRLLLTPSVLFCFFVVVFQSDYFPQKPGGPKLFSKMSYHLLASNRTSNLDVSSSSLGAANIDSRKKDALCWSALLSIAKKLQSSSVWLGKAVSLCPRGWCPCGLLCHLDSILLV